MGPEIFSMKVIVKLISVIDNWGVSGEIVLKRMTRNLTGNVNIGLVNGAVREQAITWANLDPGICPHTASLGHNDLNLV